jgi:exodeoxyribonuclease-3
MKIISFNLNGLRSVLTKDKSGAKITSGETVLETLIKEQNPDIICFQEIRCSEDVKLNIIDFESYGYKDITLNCAQKKGYSGTGIFSKIKPLNIQIGFNNELNDDELNNEGRLITYEFPKFFLINTYVPNSKADLSRLDYRINTWEKSILNYIKHLQKTDKQIIFCGDLNVAHKDIDVHNPIGAKGTHGFTLDERNALQKLLDECDLIDSFRMVHPNEPKYSWFSNFAKSRERGKGWRIDYFLISQKLKTKIVNADILSEYFGSDHLPILLDLKL